MAGGLMVKPAGRVTLSPLGLSQLMAERPSTTLGTSGEGDKPIKLSKRANLARLAAQRRLDSVLAPQRPQLDRVVFTDYLRSGSI